MRRTQFSLKTLLWLMAVVAAFLGGSRLERRMARHRADAETRPLAALAEKTEFDFIEQPLESVVNYLQERHQIIILLDTNAINAVGISIDTPITDKRKGIALRSALKILLRDLDLTYVIQDGVLKITSLTEAENILRTETKSVPSGPGTRF